MQTIFSASAPFLAELACLSASFKERNCAYAHAEPYQVNKDGNEQKRNSKNYCPNGRWSTFVA
jgi:hypothetical protein